MAHVEQRQFCESVKNKYPDFFKNKKVLDIGSLDINGSNRDLFEDCNYIGLDVGEGRNVDVVSIGHLFQGPDEYFDTIISTEVFEHDMFYEETIKNVMRMLKPGGLFLFTCGAPGRPEHGTRRCGAFCAPLLLEVSEEWADYYKNLTPEDIRKTSNFNETFPDCYFEIKDTNIEIPSDLYFYGVKGGVKFLDDTKPKFDKEKFANDIFVIDSWPDNESKENDLISLIKVLKTYNIPILLTGHYPIKVEIQKLVDYYLFDKKNDLLLNKDFEAFSVTSGRWSNMGSYRIDNENEYHHDYAIWDTMRNAFNFCKYLGKEYIHFLEYDNIPDEIQYRQAFIERLHDGFDAVLYEYAEGSTVDKHFAEFCATFIFSIKTDIALKTIEQINTKEDYFIGRPKGWQLERVFLDCLKKVTSNIHISEYIANDNELNTQAVWNRDGMFRNGGVFQVYAAVDERDELNIHVISGFHEKEAQKDYLIEIVYKNTKLFYNLKKGEYYTKELGKYSKGERLKVYYQGVKVYDEFLGKDVNEFRKMNKLTRKYNPDNKKSVNVYFVDGPLVEIKEDNNCLYEVQFIDKKTEKVEFTMNLKSNHWCKSVKKYYVDWLIKIKGIDCDFYYEHHLNLENQRVMIAFESKSLGDSLAWIGQVDKFRKTYGCKIICSTFQNDLFKDQYPEIEFVKPGTNVNNIYALYRLGLFYDDKREIDFSKHLSDPKKEPLMKVASDILGLNYTEEKPKLKKIGKNVKKRVSIAIHGTSQCKYWNNPTGWQDVTDFLKGKGYEVRLLSREHDDYMGNKHPKGIIQQKEGPITEVIKSLQESELFIGISSGLSWLSWAAGTPTILISGFTDDDLEPTQGVTRMINKSVCNSCWSDYSFDPGDWNWCPVNKGTEKQFECSKTITSDEVIEQINRLLF
jgi:hypothetical protein